MKYTDFYKYLLNEAITVGDRPVLTAPLKDSDVIRLYHGFYNPLDGIKIAKYGVSGKELANRVYSFESNNNPYGLFMTPEFRVAKNFAGSHILGKNEKGENINLGVILEINAKVSNLEAPLWPGGGFTVQGQLSQYWDNQSGIKSILANREKGRLEKRQAILQSTRKDKEFEFIKQSDRPELAASLFAMGESQALFVGDLNPNMIRAVWIIDTEIDPRYGTFKRVSRQEFLNKYEHLLKKPENRRDSKYKIYRPADEWQGLSDFIDRFAKQNKYNKEEIEKIIQWSLENNKDNLVYTLERNLWSKQLKQAIKDLNLDPENKYILPQ